jgi:hypothetical protein
LSNVSTVINKLDAQLKTLQQLFVNLNMTVSNNYATFTGHTGLPGLHNAV